jgi:hypothetical protein
MSAADQRRIKAMQIKNLFDSSRDIYRTIEKVITYNASQEARLKAEITEYIVTESIEAQFERLLNKMQFAMETGGENEVGVWVSGFYGSGKSSFTKYLGLALDQSIQVEGTRFLKCLQDRMTKAQTRALLATVAARYPAAVVLLDLASEMLAGATMQEVSTVLYYKVLQWAGYSQNLKVAALERRLKKDGRYAELTTRIKNDLGVDWCEVQNDPLVIDSLIPEIAHELYPALFRTSSAFNTETVDFVRFENVRVQEMIEIVREASGKETIIFIIDEVGQYVASRDNLILNLDGLAKNLKQNGNGKVWIIGTAQQTLTEDDPRAALNSPLLYKLSARFPIQIDLESKDIKEICYRRLLGKSPAGEKELGVLFEQHGPELRFNTKLQDAKYYDVDFDKTAFTNLYPFLPAHFDILLHLLGALAKSTGGIGLRSAIKVIQDILIEGPEGHHPVADQPVGWLATTVTLYDALEKDIRRAAPSIHKAVGKALIRFPDSNIHQEVAKTVAILQILSNMPVTVQNIASLTHPAVDAASRREQVEAAVNDLISDGFVPFGDKDGNLCFFSEKINDIDQERAQIPLRSMETRRIQNEALRETFSPLPSTHLHGTFSVVAGLKAASGGMLASLAGDKETIQMVVEFVAPQDYETARIRLVDESRQHSAQYIIYLLGRTASEINELVAEIYRSREIVNHYRSDPDQEVKDYCSSQTGLANKRAADLEHLLKQCLSQGSFIFRGQVSAAESLDHDLLTAAKKHLGSVAEQVFDRYDEAPLRADTNLAEKFLRQSNLKAISSDIDPLGLVQIVGGTPQINTNHNALISIRDYIDRYGAVDGKRLSEHFSDAPFGWSPDTLRYLVAALLVNGEIKLKISGREIKVSGQQAIEGLRTNNTFKTVGISLRDGQIAPDVLARAAQRLTELTGDSVIPLEQEISKVAAKSFPQFQQHYGPLEEKLKNLGLPGVENVRDLNHDLAEILETDASDVPQRLGSADSTLYKSLKWASEVSLALTNGLEKTIRELREHWKEILALPDTGTPGQLRAEVEEALQPIAERLGQDNFYVHTADLNTTLTTIKNHAREAALKMRDVQTLSIHAAQETLQQLYEWAELNNAEQSQTLAQLDALGIAATHDLHGLKQLLNQQYVIQSQAAGLEKQVVELGHKRQLERLQEEQAQATREGRTHITRSIKVSHRVSSTAQLEELIQQLQALKNELAIYGDIEVTIELKD